MAKCMQCGGAKKTLSKKMAKGGANYGEAITKATNKFFPRSLSTGPNYEGFANMKKGGATSVINRPVKPGCRGGMVKDANGNCVEVRKAKKGMNFKDLSGDRKITRKDVLIGRGVIPKKANGGPILDKLKAKLAAGKEKRAEKKITRQIVKSVKSSGKIIK